MCGKLHSQPTREEISKPQCQCTEKWVSDLLGILMYCQQKNIIPDSPPPFNYKDHSYYLWQLLRNNKLGLNITLISDLLMQYEKDSSGTGWKCYKALKMLSSTTMGKSRASPLYVAEVFKAPLMKEIITPDNMNRYYSQIMGGLNVGW